MKYAYYPGCSLSGTAKEYDISSRAVARALGIDLEEIPDWNCCGATSAHATSHLLSVALPARNLGLAEFMGLDVAIPCAACYHNLANARYEMGKDKELAAEVNSITEAPYTGKAGVKSFLEVITQDFGVDNLKPLVKKPLAGLKVAAYYGCLLVRPRHVTQFDDPEDPQSMDSLVRVLGGEPVPWAGKVDCCGGGHTLARTDIVVSLANDILSKAKEVGAEAIVAACPMCQGNLDQRQEAAEERFGTSYRLPIYYFTQLLGLALGLPARDLALNTHFVDAAGLLRQKQLA